jgi:DNA ligase-1
MKPMLGVAAKLEELRFPCTASPKLDGVRALVINGVVLSRTLKPIPNKFVQSQFSKFEHWDGELIVGEPTSKTCYRDTVSGVMSVEGEPKVRFHAFDHFEHPSQDYRSRVARLKGVVPRNVLVVPQHVVTCLDTLLKLEEKMLNQGYEGLILRDPNGVYKFGRSTVKEGLLLKVKRFVDAEATVIGFEERMHNGNEATTDELGRTKRSSHSAGKTGRGDLGAIIVSYGGIEFNVGTGFTDSERELIWKERDSFLGRLLKFKYFPVGVKQAPRHPVFIGWRDEIDK